MIIAHKIRLNPTSEQEEYLWKAAHNARFVFNWGLATWKELYESGEKVTMFSLKIYFNSIKREKFPWVLETCKSVCEYALQDLNSAFQKFFKQPNVGYPNFKSRKKSIPAFGISNDQFWTDGHWLKINKLNTPINMTEPLRFNGKIMSARFSYKAGYWFVAIAVEIEIPYRHNGNGPIGLDLGLKDLIVTSDAEVFENQKIFRNYERKLRKLQKALARKSPGSNRWQKAKLKLGRLYLKISNLRKDFLHKTTTILTREYGFIGVENLNVSGMLKNRKLSKSLSDASFSEIKRQLEYKALIYGSFVQEIDQFFPSTKLCHVCRYKNDNLTLADRTWVCPNCGAKHHRDHNAAINIRNEALRIAFP